MVSSIDAISGMPYMLWPVPNLMPRCPGRDWNVLNPEDPYSIWPVCPSFSRSVGVAGPSAILICRAGFFARIVTYNPKHRSG